MPCFPVSHACLLPTDVHCDHLKLCDFSGYGLNILGMYFLAGVVRNAVCGTVFDHKIASM